ncbi:hypothetical protein ACN20G_30650 (plasmid) [Streptomyces sp. BI20]|uniref:hypothetical protein n=1 Tax=Streptomyces sp. BI20 TaxID=3403460 RepID=UPI003C782854
MPPARRPRPPRPAFVPRVLPVMLLAAGLGLALPAPEAAGRAAAGPDLVVDAAAVTAAPGTSVAHTVGVRNRGAGTRGPVLLTYVTPAYTHVDRFGPALPEGCEVRHVDLDPVVPEVVTCRIPAGLAEGARTSFVVPLAVTTRARLTGGVGGLLDAMPAPGSPDRETAPEDNWVSTELTLVGPVPEAPPGEPVDLFLVPDTEAAGTEAATEVVLEHGNRGPRPARSVRVVAVAPFLTRWRGPLPAGCGLVLDDPDPAVPRIVDCVLPRTAADGRGRLRLALETLPGAPTGTLTAPVLVAPADPGDVDADQRDNLGVITLRRPAPAGSGGGG